MSWLAIFFFFTSFAQEGNYQQANADQMNIQQQINPRQPFPPSVQNAPQAQQYPNPPPYYPSQTQPYSNPPSYAPPPQPYPNYPPGSAQQNQVNPYFPQQPYVGNSFPPGQPPYGNPQGGNGENGSSFSAPGETQGRIVPGGTAADASSEDLIDPMDSGRRDPFKLPNYLIDKLKIKNSAGGSVVSPTQVVEKDPLKRWPLSEYQLVGISWDIRSPKILVVDKTGQIHLLTLKKKLGVLGAVLVKIEEGRALFNEKGTIKTLNLKK